VGAITLQETRLTVDETCIDCGLCLPACPTGALAGEVEALPAVVVSPPRARYDLVVIGAGPAGSTAARTAAEAGLSVLLVEKRQEIGSPVRCAEGIGHGQLTAFIAPDPRWISTEVTGAQLTVHGGNDVETLQAEGGRGYVLERRVFDRVLAEEAARAGAEVRVKTAAVGLVCEEGAVRGVWLAAPGATWQVAASVVVAADGIESLAAQWAGLETRLPLKDAMSCAQYLLAGIEIDPNRIVYEVGRGVAPGGYAWVFPKGEGLANVGLGVQADLADEPALNYLNRFIEGRPHLSAGSPVTLIAGGVPVAPPPPRLVTDGLMVIGDAARQVDPLTGGGIASGMEAGRLAARVAIDALQKGDVSAGALGAYETAWQGGLGRRLARNYRLKEKYGPDRRAFARLFMVAAAGK
jgi:digeranylgeranylglycerophospholipid reductase